MNAENVSFIAISLLGEVDGVTTYEIREFGKCIGYLAHNKHPVDAKNRWYCFFLGSDITGFGETSSAAIMDMFTGRLNRAQESLYVVKSISARHGLNILRLAEGLA